MKDKDDYIKWSKWKEWCNQQEEEPKKDRETLLTKDNTYGNFVDNSNINKELSYTTSNSPQQIGSEKSIDTIYDTESKDSTSASCTQQIEIIEKLFWFKFGVNEIILH